MIKMDKIKWVSNEQLAKFDATGILHLYYKELTTYKKILETIYDNIDENTIGKELTCKILKQFLEIRTSVSLTMYSQGHKKFNKSFTKAYENEMRKIDSHICRVEAFNTNGSNYLRRSSLDILYLANEYSSILIPISEDEMIVGHTKLFYKEWNDISNKLEAYADGILEPVNSWYYTSNDYDWVTFEF